MVCRVIGECRFGGEIDREFGDMVLAPGGSSTASNWSGAKQFAYVRYDPLTTQEQLNALGLPEIKEASMQLMDDVSLIENLYRVGQAYGERSINLQQHFAGFVPAASTPPPR